MTCPTAFLSFFLSFFFEGVGAIVFTLKLHDRACGSVAQNVNCWRLVKYRRNLEVAAKRGGANSPSLFFT